MARLRIKSFSPLPMPLAWPLPPPLEHGGHRLQDRKNEKTAPAVPGLRHQHFAMQRKAHHRRRPSREILELIKPWRRRRPAIKIILTSRAAQHAGRRSAWTPAAEPCQMPGTSTKARGHQITVVGVRLPSVVIQYKSLASGCRRRHRRHPQRRQQQRRRALLLLQKAGLSSWKDNALATPRTSPRARRPEIQELR